MSKLREKTINIVIINTLLYNRYISRDFYFPKNDEFSFFPFVFYFPGPHAAAPILNLAIMLPSVLPPERVIYLIITGATKPTMSAQLVGSVLLHINRT